MGKEYPDEKLLPFSLSTSSLRARFMNIGIRQGWWFSKKTIVLAISGGSDSVAMLWFFHEFWKGRIVAAHLEHGIRGQESKNDASYVRDLCSLWQLPLELRHVSIPSLKERGESLEEAARRVRYAFLHEISRKYGASSIAIAHNADDVAETVLHNLVRGTGPYGLVGIPESRKGIIRPVIDFYKIELRKILESRNISWCEDATNADTTMTRNKIRHKLLPWIEENINDKAKKHIVDLADNMSFFRDLENDRAMAMLSFLEEHVPGSAYSFALSRVRIMSKEDIACFIRAMGRTLGLRSLSRRRLNDLISLIERSGKWRFQWQKSKELCAGQGLVGLVDIDVFEPSDEVSILSSGDTLKSGTILWSGWKINWDILENVNPDNFFSGNRQAIIPFPERSCLKVVSYGCFREKTGKIIIPWWIGNVWPVLSIGSTIFWFPALKDSCGHLYSSLEPGRGIKITISKFDVVEGAQ